METTHGLRGSSDRRDETQAEASSPATHQPKIYERQSPHRVVMVVSGFGPFGGVEENPSNILIRDLPPSLLHGEKNSSWKSDIHNQVAEWLVVETSTQGVQSTVNRLTQLASTPNSNNIPTKYIFLHMGVNVNGTGYQIEKSAYNDASFRIPDERGFQPQGELVVDDDTQHGRALTTKLPVQALVEYLQAAFPAVETKLSQNPGRFVCNYLYYTSLRQLQETLPDQVIGSLFLHIPSFDLIPQTIQQEYVSEVLRWLTQREL